MRNIIAILLLFCGMQVVAQTGRGFKPIIMVGTSQGATLSSVTLSPKVKQDMLIGYNGGVFMRYISEKYFAFQLELNYTERGWKETMAETPQYSYYRKMNYIELPFLTHIYFGEKVKGFVNLGPKIGLFLNEKEHMNFNPAEITGVTVKEQYGKPVGQKIDYGILGGAGVEFDTKIGSFGVEGRYYFGLADFFKTSPTTYFNTASMQFISINLTYALRVSKK